MHQGENLAPLFFVLVFQAAIDSLSASSGDLMPPFHSATSPTQKGHQTARSPHMPAPRQGKISPCQGELFSHSIYVDNKAGLFATRKAARDGLSLIKSHLLRFYLLIHTRTIEKRSKTEAMHVLAKQRTSSAKNIQDLTLDDGSIIQFCLEFMYLGSVFTLDLDDSEDVQN